MGGLRYGPQGLPMLKPDDRSAVKLPGSQKQMWPSTQTTALARVLFSVFFKPSAIGVTDQHIFSKNSYFAASNADFPMVMRMTTTGLFELALSAGGDFVTDLTLTSGNALKNGQWNYLAGAFVAGGPDAWVNVNGVCNTVTHAVTPSTSAHAYSVGNFASEQSGGTGNVACVGLIYEPRLYLWSGTEFQSTTARLMRGEDVRPGLVYEWMPRGGPLRAARY
jgi:hypothetical protein